VGVRGESKPDLEKVDTSSEERHAPKSGIEYERAQLLANLPDPDEGKSEEERRAIVSSPTLLGSFSLYPPQDKKLMWKVDLWLIPWLSLLYLLSFLDRTNIGNARLANMEPDLGMVPGDFQMALTIFFISYAVAEPITNGLLKRLTPRIFFFAIIIAWGVVRSTQVTP